MQVALYVIQWMRRGKWTDDKFMIPSCYSEALDALDAIAKRWSLPSCRLVPVNDDVDLIPVIYKR